MNSKNRHEESREEASSAKVLKIYRCSTMEAVRKFEIEQQELGWGERSLNMRVKHLCGGEKSLAWASHNCLHP